MIVQLFLFAHVLALPGFVQSDVQSPANRPSSPSAEFVVGGITFGTSLSEFKAAAPAAVETDLGRTYQVSLATTLLNPQVASFTFAGDRVCEIRIEYSAETTQNLGGHNAVLARLVDRFGSYTKTWDSPFENEAEFYQWQLPEARRWLQFSTMDDGSAQLCVRHVETPGLTTSKWGFDAAP